MDHYHDAPPQRGVPNQMMRAMRRVSMMLPGRHPLRVLTESERESGGETLIRVSAGTFVGRIFVHGREVQFMRATHRGLEDMLIPVVPDDAGKINETERCAICLRAWEDKSDDDCATVLLPHCMHVFCKKCIVAWIHINPSCPTCRQNVDGSETVGVGAQE